MDEVRLVPAVERAAAILDLIAASAASPTLSEIARSLSLPKSSVHGLCQTLCHLDLLREDRGRYTMGAHPMRWAQAAVEQTDMIAEFGSLIAGNAELAAYTITLSSLHGTEVVYLACQNATAPLGFTFRMGMRLPAAFTATGKAMLAEMPVAEREALLAHPLPAPMTQMSVQSIPALREEIAQTVVRGFSVDDGQIRAGMSCLGAAVLDGAGRPVAGVALSMTSAEARPEVIERAGQAIAAFARSLSARAGFAG